MIWILYGLDEYRRIERRKELVRELLGEAPPDFALNVWRGKEFSEARLPELYELPFLAAHKVVVLTEGETLSRSALQVLARYAEKPAAHTRLILEFAQEAKPALPSSPAIHYEAFSPLRAKEAIDWTLKEAQRLGFSLTPEAAARLVETVGADLRTLHQTLTLLQVYRLSELDQPLSVTEVDHALGLHPQYNVYKLIDALAERKSSEVLQIMSAFAEDTRTYPLAQILWHLRQFFQNLAILYWTKAPARTETIQKQLKLRFPFQAKPYERALRFYSLPTCQQMLAVLRETEARQKGLFPSRQSERQLLLGLALRLTDRQAPPLKTE